MAEFKVFAGIDWAHVFHQACVVDDKGKVLWEARIEHTAEGLSELCAKLIELAGGDVSMIPVGIETPNGIVVETLVAAGFSVFVINPKQIDRFRDRFAMSGAKDDRRDARVIADSLRTDPRSYRQLEPEADIVVEIRELSRLQSELQQERVRLTNRLSNQLLRYFPAFAKLVADDPGAPWALALWKAIPTPERAKTVQTRTVQSILKAHRIRRLDGQGVLQILREPVMNVSAATVLAARRHIKTLANQLEVLNIESRECKKELEQSLDRFAGSETDPGKAGEQHLVTIAMSMPGIGPIILGALLAEGARVLIAGDYAALRLLSGVAPVTKGSGRTQAVRRRYGHNHRLGNALYNAARVSSQCDEVFKAGYKALRDRGHTHGRALRTIGDRLLGTLCAMIRSKTLFDPTRRTARTAA
jgi:transposase